jgi:hypothetical protein
MNSYREIVEWQKSSLKSTSCHIPDRPPQCDRSADQSGADETQTHTHEFEASVKLAEEGDDRHNHRVAGVTSEAIPLGYHNHKHTVFALTDFFGHLHQVAVETGPAICVSEDKHVHFISGNTTFDDGHFHEFDFSTLIQSPLLPNP